MWKGCAEGPHVFSCDVHSRDRPAPQRMATIREIDCLRAEVWLGLNLGRGRLKFLSVLEAVSQPQRKKAKKVLRGMKTWKLKEKKVVTPLQPGSFEL